MTSAYAGSSKKFVESRFKDSEDVISKHKLFSELSKKHYEEKDSIQSRNSHIISSKKLHCVLQHRCKTLNVPSTFLTESEREDMNYACTFVKVMMDWKFNYKEFYEALCVHPIFPLEFIFRLHLLGIMSLDTYLCEIQNQPEIISCFCKSVVDLFSQYDPNIEFECLMASGISVYVINKIFIDDLEEIEDCQYSKIKKICNLILDSTIEKFIKSKREQSEQMRMPSLNLLWNNSNIQCSVLKAFCIDALEKLIASDTDIEVAQAISQHSNWTRKHVESGLGTFIEKILKTLNSESISSTVLNIVNTSRPNWKILLTVISVYLASCQHALTLVLEWADHCLREAFEKFEQISLFRGFLIVRHATLPEHSDSPSAYFNWLQKTFSDPSSSLAKEDKSFEFLMECLTELVPAEKEEFLRVHTEKAFFVPKICRTTYLDYVALVKTRLSELKPQHSPDTVLNKMLAVFETTRKIPTALLELSMLQKHQYLNFFLPKLLTPRVLPVVPDTKMKFLRALKLFGKIPKEMFEKYEVECREATEKCSDVEPMDIEMKGINEQITDWSMQFMFQIQDGVKDAEFLKRYVDEFRQNLLNMLKQFKTSDGETSFVVLNVEMDVSFKEMMHEIVGSYCIFQSEVFRMKLQNLNLWDLALDLQNHRQLHSVLYLTLWEKITLQEKETTIDGSSLLLLRISMLRLAYPFMKERSDDSEPMSFCDFVFKALPLTTSDEINYFCRFACKYLNSACTQDISEVQTPSTLPPFIPINLIKKFRFATVRAIPQLRGQTENVCLSNDHLNEVVTLYRLTSIQHLFAITKLTFTEWLTFESNVLPENDGLSTEERCKCIWWCIQHLCDFEPNAYDQSSNANVKYCCRTIFRLLLLKYDECPSFAGMILILKDLVERPLQIGTEVSMASKPWIYDEFNAAVAKRKESKLYDLYINILIKRFLRLICELPYFLLFQDFSFQAAHTYCVKELSDLINNWIRLYNGDHLFLPDAVMIHIIKSLSLLLLHSKSYEEFQNNDTSVKLFLSSTPLFVLSLIEHWSTVKCHVPSKLSNRQNQLCPLLTNIDSVASWIREMRNGKPISSMHLKGLENWAVGYMLMKEKVELCNIFQYAVSKLIDFEIVESAIQCYVAFNIITDTNNTNISADLLEVLKRLFELEKTEFLYPVCYCQSSLKNILSPFVWWHFPAGCLRLLFLLFNEEEIRNVEKQIISKWISLILCYLTECNRRYADRISINQFYHCLINNGEICKKSYGILNLIFLQEATQATKRILELTPLDCITLIPKEIVSDSDDFLKCFLSQ